MKRALVRGVFWNKGSSGRDRFCSLCGSLPPLGGHSHLQLSSTFAHISWNATSFASNLPLKSSYSLMLIAFCSSRFMLLSFELKLPKPQWASYAYLLALRMRCNCRDIFKSVGRERCQIEDEFNHKLSKFKKE